MMYSLSEVLVPMEWTIRESRELAVLLWERDRRNLGSSKFHFWRVTDDEGQPVDWDELEAVA